MNRYRNQYSKRLFEVVLFLFVMFIPLCMIGQQTNGAKIRDNSSNTSSAALSDLAILDLDSSQKGFALPRMTTAQRNAIRVDKLKDQGLAIFNTTTDCVEYFNSYIEAWVSLCGDTLPAEITVLPNQCSEIKAVGEYYQNHELDATNGIVAKVTTSKAGAYHIIARSTNGYSFEAKGRFPSTGTFTVFLKGDGKPSTGYNVDANGQPTVKGDKLSFEINNKAIACDVYVFVNKDMPIYTINSAVTNGRYFTAEDVTTLETMTVNVKVDRIGRWVMNTDNATGVKFSGEGVFTTTGTQTVTLKSTGKTTTAGTNEVTITTNSLVTLGEPNKTAKTTYKGEGVSFNVVNCSEAVFSNKFYVGEEVPLGTTLKFKIRVLAPAKNHTIATGYQIVTTGKRLIFKSGPITLNYDRFATGSNANIQEVTLTVVAGDQTHGNNFPGKEELIFFSTSGFNTYECNAGEKIYAEVITRVPTTIKFNSPYTSVTKGVKYLPPYATLVSSTTYLDVEFYAGGTGSVSVSTDKINGISFTGTLTITNGIAKGRLAGTGSVAASIPAVDSKFTLKRDDTNATVGEVTVDFVYRQMKVVSYGNQLLFATSGGRESANGIKLLTNKDIFGWDGLVRIDGFLYLDAAGVNYGALSTTNSTAITTFQNDVARADIVSITGYASKYTNQLLYIKDIINNDNIVLIYTERYTAKSGTTLIDSYHLEFSKFVKYFDSTFDDSNLTGGNDLILVDGFNTENLGTTGHFAKLYDGRFYAKYPSIKGYSSIAQSKFGFAPTGDEGDHSFKFNIVPKNFKALYRRNNPLSNDVYAVIHDSKGLILIGNARPLNGFDSTSIGYNSPLAIDKVNSTPITTTTYGVDKNNLMEVDNSYHFLNMMLWSIDYAQKNRTPKP